MDDSGSLCDGPSPGRTDAVIPANPKSTIITGQGEPSYAGMRIRMLDTPCNFLLFEQFNHVGLCYNSRASKLSGTTIVGDAVVMEIKKSELRAHLKQSKFRQCKLSRLPSPVPACRRVAGHKRPRSPPRRDMAFEVGRKLLKEFVEGAFDDAEA